MLNVLAKANTSDMAAKGRYVQQTKVDWMSTNVFSQFKLWCKEVERITNGPLASRSDKVKLNHVYIWAGAQAESLIEAQTSEDNVNSIPKAIDLKLMYIYCQ